MAGLALDKTDNEIDFAGMMRIFWRRRWMILIAACLGLLFAIHHLRQATYVYTAELKVSAASRSGGEGAASRLGGLASLAGLGLSSAQTATPFQLYLETLHSREVAAELAQRPDLMRVIFSSEWNAAEGRWQQPESGRGSVIKAIKGVLGLPIYKWRAPDAARLQEFLKSAIKIVQEPTSPIVLISFNHPDPQFATRFLDAVDRTADAHLRRRSIARANDHIRYLSAKLATVLLAEHRIALSQALGEQERTRMMASSSAAFAAEPISAAAPSLRPTSPQPYLVLAAGLIVGTLLGMLAALVVAYVRR